MELPDGVTFEDGVLTVKVWTGGGRIERHFKPHPHRHPTHGAVLLEEAATHEFEAGPADYEPFTIRASRVESRDGRLVLLDESGQIVAAGHFTHVVRKDAVVDDRQGPQEAWPAEPPTPRREEQIYAAAQALIEHARKSEEGRKALAFWDKHRPADNLPGLE